MVPRRFVDGCTVDLVDLRAPGNKYLLERVEGLKGMKLRGGVKVDKILDGNGGAEGIDRGVGVGGRLVDITSGTKG